MATREIHVSAITDAVKKLCMEANYDLEPDMLRAFDRALQTERSAAGRQVLQILKDNAQMAKTKKNVVEPSTLIEKYGADSARMFSLFASPPENTLDWSDAGVEGMSRFIGRLWRYVSQHGDQLRAGGRMPPPPEGPVGELVRLVHKTIKKVTDDTTSRFRFNTAISAVMELMNALSTFELKGPPFAAGAAFAMQTIVKLLSPYCPHVAEELWEQLGYPDGLVAAGWPAFDAEVARAEQLVIPVQVNGKVRARLTVPADVDDDTLREQALAHPQVQAHVSGKAVDRVVIVKGKLVGVVAR